MPIKGLHQALNRPQSILVIYPGGLVKVIRSIINYFTNIHKTTSYQQITVGSRTVTAL